MAVDRTHHIDFDKSAYETWEKLENLFRNKIINLKVFLKMKDRETLNEHFVEVCVPRST